MMESVDTTSVLLIACIAVTLTSIFCYFIFRSRVTILNHHIKQLSEQISIGETSINNERALLHQSNQEKEALRIQLAEISRDHKHVQQQYHDYVNDTNSMQQRFEILANKILDSKSEKFEAEQKRSLEQVLSPLKEKIKTFESKVDQTNKESIIRHSTLKTQIQFLREQNDKITTEAQNLTKALKGDTKLQGNWGELILESILEKSGLEKDREYFVQNSFTNELGRHIRPDVIIHLPQKKRIIIDSKVSITAYEKLINSVDEQEQQTLAKAHALSIKKHIDGLSAKNYYDIYKIESPDFVLMFIPIDTAFSAALSKDSNLYSYAFEKNIVIVTPATLLATLKTVDTMWKNEKQQRHAIEIAEEAGKMYDKFSALVEDLNSLGRRIDQTKDHFNQSMKKLHYGRGDLISRADKLRKLGVKVKKEINQGLVDLSKESS